MSLNLVRLHLLKSCHEIKDDEIWLLDSGASEHKSFNTTIVIADNINDVIIWMW